MKIFVFGGTTEGRELAEKLLALGHDVAVSVATDYGRFKEAGSRVRLLEGRLDSSEMEEILRGYDICVDATHPYAAEAGENIKAASSGAGLAYIRLGRTMSAVPDSALIFQSAGEAADYLKDKRGRILLTTGAKEIAAFAPISPERLFIRILPSVESLEAALKAGIRPSNIIAMEGPFSSEFNELILREKAIDYMVTKDGGRAGGFPEKVSACENCKVQMLLIARPACREGMSMDEVVQRISSMDRG
ncbi:precorrin-6A reductase [Butyrivibrio sp. MC2013]|uniref:precorrin-6A reductase n=1 Tax=Butyrivibrio sp. MC2013 TaxID=1280686 RepID=UPI00041C13D6|nr:precorrin-6A reductase [Butyrivibrio sp. MC2013]